MFAANCAPVSVTLLPIVLSFAAVPSNPLLTLVVGNVSAVTWFPDTSANQHVTPDLATMTNSTVYLGNDYLHVGDSEGLDISHIGHTTLHHQNVFLHYLMFFMCLILPNRCYLFKNSIVIIMFMLNFTLLCFMSRISSTRKFSFLVRVMMAFISSSSLLPRQFLKLFGLFASPRLSTCGIVVWVIQPSHFKFVSFQQ